MKIFVLNGPNLNMLGTREKAIYGPNTLKEIEDFTTSKLDPDIFNLQWWQSNSESEIIDRIQKLCSVASNSNIRNQHVIRASCWLSQSFSRIA